MEQNGATNEELGEPWISVKDALELVGWLGRQLQTIPREQRHNVLAALQNKRSAFVRQYGEQFASQMIDAFVNGWTDFPDNTPHFGRKKP